jgi:negative regulator of flagellin synthesis FlgM
MRIPGDISKITGVYGSHRNARRIGETGAVTPKKDVLSISGEAKDIQTVSRALKDVPDLRRDRVDEVLKKYGSGGYNVSGRDVAEKIVNSVFDKKA